MQVFTELPVMSSLTYGSEWVGYLEPERNQTVFGEMVLKRYGTDYQGLPWCVVFVFAVHPKARCLGKPCAGITSLIRKVAVRFRWRGRCYKPRRGDLVFLRCGDEIASHVEIVEDFDGDYLTSIGGNAVDPSGYYPPDYGGAVARRFRDIQDNRIVGFCKM